MIKTILLKFEKKLGFIGVNDIMNPHFLVKMEVVFDFA